MLAVNSFQKFVSVQGLLLILVVPLGVCTATGRGIRRAGERQHTETTVHCIQICEVFSRICGFTLKRASMHFGSKHCFEK